MLVEHGFVRAQLPDGREWTFTPSIGRIAELGTPEGVVELYAALHGPRAERVAREVLAALCDQGDASDLIGWLDEDGGEHDGAMPAAERLILARHLMQHGVCGKPDKAAARALTASATAPMRNSTPRRALSAWRLSRTIFEVSRSTS